MIGSMHSRMYWQMMEVGRGLIYRFNGPFSPMVAHLFWITASLCRTRIENLISVTNQLKRNTGFILLHCDPETDLVAQFQTRELKNITNDSAIPLVQAVGCQKDILSL